MRQRDWIRVLLFIAVVVATVTAAQARRSVPIAIRMTAYVNEKPEGVRPEYVWTVSTSRHSTSCTC